MRFLLLLLAIQLGLGANVASASRPNVLLVTADDLGLQLSCYGDSTITTPHLDQLAARGVQFTTAYVAQASCSPSRSAMLTGLFPHGNGHYGLANANVGFEVHEPLRENLLPNVLKRHGYRTGIIGKLHVNPESSFQFDERFNEGFGSRDIQLQVDQAAKFWAQSDDRPWFLMFNVFDPHVARKPLGEGRRGPQYFPDVVKGIPHDPLTRTDVQPWPWQGIDQDAQLDKIAGYYNCVKRIDVAIGRLMDQLRAIGQERNTLIILLGDHGPPFSRGKTSCYEAGLRVPFLLIWPGVTVPHVSARLVSSTDIYPTILDAAECAIAKPVHGRSLRPVAQPNDSLDPGTGWRETLVGEFHYHGASPFFPRRAITDGRFKLIHNLVAAESTATASVDGDKAPVWAMQRPEGDRVRDAFARLANPPEWELYDLSSDPIEFENRIDDDSLINVRGRLKAALAKWQEETADPFVDSEFRDRVKKKYANAGAN